MADIKNIKDFARAKQEKNPIAMVTCYDYAFARMVAESGIDVILVGDSLGNVVAGYDTTLPVTLDQMIYHAGIVRRGAPEMFIVADLPFMSYHVSVEDTMRNCGRIMKETGANSVKLEGGKDFRHIVESLVKASIPVMGHLGLTPQSIHKFGTYVVRAKDKEEADKLREDAGILQDAGSFAIVLEKIPATLAKEVTESLKIPTIGIGAGPQVDGQVLVLHDMLGLTQEFSPRFLRRYHNFYQEMLGAVKTYIQDVRNVDFPNEKEQY